MMLKMSLAVSAACVLLAGCGSESSKTAQVESSASSGSGEPTAVVASVTPEHSASPARTQAQPMPGTMDGLPPEIAIGDLNTSVTPGQPLQIEVFGTPDVTAMALSDGINDPAPFYHDVNGDVWRVSYRVPLRVRQERLGLSVTAQNDLNRWRRVWVFLDVQSPKSEVTASVDSVLAK